MAMSKFCYLFVVGVMMIIGTLVSNTSQVSAQVKRCDDDLLDFTKICYESIAKFTPNPAPSKECCEVVNRMNIPCICDDTQVELVISKQKMVNVCGICGKPFAHGAKCGSYTNP